MQDGLTFLAHLIYRQHHCAQHSITLVYITTAQRHWLYLNSNKYIWLRYLRYRSLRGISMLHGVEFQQCPVVIVIYIISQSSMGNSAIQTSLKTRPINSCTIEYQLPSGTQQLMLWLALRFELRSLGDIRPYAIYYHYKIVTNTYWSPISHHFAQGLPRRGEWKQTASTWTRGEGNFHSMRGGLLVTCKASVPTPNYQK